MTAHSSGRSSSRRTTSGTTTRTPRTSSPTFRSTARSAKVLQHFDKNGFAYTIDRATGEVLVAEPFVPVNWASKIDLATGRPVVDPAKITGARKGNTTYICPSLEGGKNPASPAAFSPAHGLLLLSDRATSA